MLILIAFGGSLWKQKIPNYWMRARMSHSLVLYQINSNVQIPINRVEMEWMVRSIIAPGRI